MMVVCDVYTGQNGLDCITRQMSLSNYSNLKPDPPHQAPKEKVLQGTNLYMPVGWA